MRTSFEPSLSFGPDPAEPALFTLTGDWRKLRVVLQNDPAWWAGEAAAQQLQPPTTQQQPFLLGELQSYALSVRMLARWGSSAQWPCCCAIAPPPGCAHP